jgi:glucose/arabinose dehydrogenase
VTAATWSVHCDWFEDDWGASMTVIRSAGWVAVALGAVVVLFVGAGTAAALCKYQFDCHLRPTEPAPTGIEDFEGSGGGAFELADGFIGTTVVTGLKSPTDLVFLPDGRMLVSEKAGVIRSVADGALEARPFLDIRPRVNDYYFRGIVDIAVDPDFAENPYVYVTYAVQGPGGDQSKEPIAVRISRFTVRNGVADGSSEEVLIGKEGKPGTSCRALPKGADCLPADGDHIGSELVFAPDGTIFVSTGDGGGLEVVEPMAFLSHDLEMLGGKILHVDREGRGLSSNPWWTGDPTANRSKIWAVGFRNPFRMSLLPGDPDRLLVGDVGWNSFEELDVAERGSDYGWPCFEGPERTPDYQDTTQCAAYYADAGEDAAQPWLSTPQPDALSFTAGLSLADARDWPEEYRDRYLYGDWLKSELYTVPLDPDVPAEDPARFATNAAGPVSFVLSPEGVLYFVAVNTGEIRTIEPR